MGSCRRPQVAVRVADFEWGDGGSSGGTGAGGRLRGMLVTLDEKGLVAVAYLGTDTVINSLGWGEVRGCGRGAAA